MRRSIGMLLFTGLQLTAVCSADTCYGYWWDRASIHKFLYPGSGPGVPLSVNAVNDTGQIAGTLGNDLGFIKTGSSFSSFSVGGNLLFPSSINDSGTVVGEYYGNPLGSSGPFSQYGFIWNGQTAVSVEAPGIHGQVIQTDLTGVNNTGQIVGFYVVNTVPEQIYSFLLQGSSFVPIAVPGGSGTEVLGIDNQGNISGVYTAANGNVQGFLKVGNTYETPFPIGHLSLNGRYVLSGGPANFEVLDVATGQLVDESALMAAIQADSSNLYSLNGINDSGEIVGTAQTFSPYVPEPGTCGLLGLAGVIALGGLAGRKKRPGRTVWD